MKCTIVSVSRNWSDLFSMKDRFDIYDKSLILPTYEIGFFSAKVLLLCYEECTEEFYIFSNYGN